MLRTCKLNVQTVIVMRNGRCQINTELIIVFLFECFVVIIIYVASISSTQYAQYSQKITISTGKAPNLP